MRSIPFRLLAPIVICVALYGFSCGGDDDNDDGDDDAGGSGGISISSPAFDDGGNIPPEYTCDNADYPEGISPPLEWKNAPADTAYFALTVFDPDANDTAHWGVFDIPATVFSFDEAMCPDGELPDGAWEALNYLEEAGYAGPCPPAGDDAHHYVFTIYSLSEAMPPFTQTPDLSEMADLIQERLIESASVTGLFGH
jgi:Raf kinase inhibitor-like YbhB/YbcL family protein